MMNAIASDDNLVEVFLEEAREVFQTIDNRLPVWRKLPRDRSALTEIRRGFHTLKGSGRMVNALDLAEVAWKVENMLNRVIDGNVQVTEPVVELVSTARDLMPRMLDAFKNRRSMGSDSGVEFLMAQADALATGQVPLPARAQSAFAAPATGGKQSQALQFAMLNRKLDRLQKRSDEALHRSEMALQLARRIAAHIGAMKEEARDRVGRAEVNLVIEQVKRLASEVQDLRRDTEHPQSERSPQRRELGQPIDHPGCNRVAPIERQHSDLERQLREARRDAAASRNLGRWALIMSALVGTAVIAPLLI